MYAGILNGSTIHLQILRTANPSAAAPMTVLLDRANGDQPWTVAASVLARSRDRVYIGNNNFNTSPKTATATFR